MRRVVAGLLLVAALAAIAASMGMNWTFWTAQGVSSGTSRVMGAISVMADIFKAALPMAIAWAWTEGKRVGAAIATAFFCGCLTLSFMSAIGFASWLHGAATEGRAAASSRYAAARGELDEAIQSLARLSPTRPVTVVGASLERGKQDRRWTISDGCKTARSESSRSYCAGIGDLQIELAGSQERDKLERRRAELHSEINRLIGGGARLENDVQAGILSRVFGVGISRVQTGLVLLVAVIVELGAAFGLFLASLPLQGSQENLAGWWWRRRAKSDFARKFSQMKRQSKPTRLVRDVSGRLMID